MLRDTSGHQFIFKAAEPRLIAGEVFAFGVRRLARRPAVPTLALTFDLPGVGPSEGMIQPFEATAAAGGDDRPVWLPDSQEDGSSPEARPSRIFGTPAFFRLWLAQVVSATGDATSACLP